VRIPSDGSADGDRGSRSGSRRSDAGASGTGPVRPRSAPVSTAPMAQWRCRRRSAPARGPWDPLGRWSREADTERAPGSRSRAAERSSSTSGSSSASGATSSTRPASSTSRRAKPYADRSELSRGPRSMTVTAVRAVPPPGRVRSWRPLKVRATAKVSSRLPATTTTTRAGGRVWPRIEPSVAAMLDPASPATTTAETASRDDPPGCSGGGRGVLWLSMGLSTTAVSGGRSDPDGRALPCAILRAAGLRARSDHAPVAPVTPS
jgi:hypothetical protein